MYTTLGTGMCFLSVRWDVPAYSSADALRDGTPVAPPGCIIRQHAARIPVSMASRATCAWKVRTLFIGSFKRHTPWSNRVGNQPWVRSGDPICRGMSRPPPEMVLRPVFCQLGFLLARCRLRFRPRRGRYAFPGYPGSPLLSVLPLWIALVHTCVSSPRAAYLGKELFSCSHDHGLSAEVQVVGVCVRFIAVGVVEPRREVRVHPPCLKTRLNVLTRNVCLAVRHNLNAGSSRPYWTVAS